MSWAFLAVSIWGAAFTVNAHWPRKPRSYFLVPSFFAGWVTGELAAHHLSWQAAATAVFVAFGALDAWPGWVGLGITLAPWAGLLALVASSRRSATEVDAAIAGALGAAPEPERGRLPRLPLMIPFLLRDRRVKVARNLRYAEGAGRRHLLDVYGPREGTSGAPVLLQVHGGGWTVGNKRQQALPLVMHMAARGWVVVAINYRLSPKSTFPAHIEDVKRSIAWIREHIADHGGDPDFVCITGGSAGGHLTALAALTPNDPEYQPGFEQVDTSLRAAVPFYGVYDWTNRGRHGRGRDGLGGFIERIVLKRRFDDDPAAFERGSPCAG
ncbi:MAG: alpha/beta hydrolase [Acidimicrobiia bacterium]|nr:alpha/beta hydrolase [Acidimicrobiia bacterium]